MARGDRPHPAQPTSFTLECIGHVRSPFRERVQAPRQPRLAAAVEGRVELLPGRHYEDALSDLDGWEYVWLLCFFADNAGRWRPKVRPPRSDIKRGVFATRAPHRPNPLGLSAVRLLRVEGLTLHIAELDLLDGTPVLDIKPYVAWCDAIRGARGGWLEDEGLRAERPGDPGPRYRVEYTDLARAQLSFLQQEHGLELAPRIEVVLATGPRPHAYRRIRPLDAGGYELAIKDWRARFRLEGVQVTVQELRSGYRPAARGAELPPVHRAFQHRFSGRRGPVCW